MKNEKIAYFLLGMMFSAIVIVLLTFTVNSFQELNKVSHEHTLLIKESQNMINYYDERIKFVETYNYWCKFTGNPKDLNFDEWDNLRKADLLK